MSGMKGKDQIFPESTILMSPLDAYERGGDRASEGKNTDVADVGRQNSLPMHLFCSQVFQNT